MRERVAGLDLLRALAILGVLLSHTLPYLYGHWSQFTYLGHLGSMGVDLFFVLSGFLIGGMLWRMGAKVGHGIELRRFWVRRWLRTLPNYYVFFALTIAMSVIAYHHWPAPLEALEVATFTQNIAWVHPIIFPESWTLAVEEWFYLLTPILLFTGMRLTRRFAVAWWSTVALMIAVPFVLRWNQTLPSSWGGYGREPVVFRLDSLAIGVAMAALRTLVPTFWRRVRRPALLLGIIAVACSYTVLYRVDLDQSFFAHTWWFELTAIGYALLLPWASEFDAFRSRWFGVTVESIAVWSYSLYLSNLGISFYIGYTWQKTLERSVGWAITAFVVANVLAFVVSYAAYHLVELPFLRLRDRVVPRQSVPPPV